jgi:hypothetical protein
MDALLAARLTGRRRPVTAGHPGDVSPTQAGRHQAHRTHRGVLGMSVLIIGKFQGDTATFRQALADRAGEFAKIADMARSAGGVHHRFGVGDGFVVMVDEWETIEQFQQFFSDPDLQAFIGSVGAAPAPPEITISEAVASADQY